MAIKLIFKNKHFFQSCRNRPVSLNYRLVLISVTILLVSGWLRPAETRAQTTIDLEMGLVQSGYNDLRIPGDTGSDLSLSEELSTDSGFYYRAGLSYRLKERHEIMFTAAPLVVTAAGSVDRPVMFQETEFAANTDLESTYQFNTYRLTYRYTLMNAGNLSLTLGFTALLRDALIELDSNEAHAEKSNVGIVPLLHFRINLELSSRTSLLCEGDALAGPQGRAEDVFFGFVLKPDQRLALRAGYRIIEGGADNDEVYTFSLFHHYAIGLSYYFR